MIKIVFVLFFVLTMAGFSFAEAVPNDKLKGEIRKLDLAHAEERS